MKISFSAIAAPKRGVLVILATEGPAFGPLADAVDSETGGHVRRAADAASFKGKSGQLLDIVAAPGLEADRILVAGLGKPADLDARSAMMLGGKIAGKLSDLGARSATLRCDAVEGADLEVPDLAAELALGLRLRAYRFDTYKSKKKDDKPALSKVAIQAEKPGACRKADAPRAALAQGVHFARDLTNEPPNILFPTEFAKRLKALSEVGLEVEVLGEKQLAKLGMNALLAVGAGSRQESQVVVMHHNGGGDTEPVAVVGKGVTFDTGGISLKPGAGMGDMKGDMAGASCVSGLMHTLAAREAKANVVGLVGLVENMPDGRAQRPGDIVTSMAGKTIEVLNTDAEGRLVLADVLHYARDRFSPRLMIDLATLTGAIIIALGKHNAGLFSNDDELAARLQEAGAATGERVWRMPLADAYDKMIDSPTADMKNIGGREAGSVTAAQFLKRFVGDTPWAHLDIAGTGMDAPKSEISPSWGSGFGVRLLDRLIADHYEDG